MAYPANATFKHQDKSSRLWALLTIFVIKSIALFPHAIVMMVLQLISGFLGLIGIFVVLFTGKYPKSFADFIVNVTRWSWRVTTYCTCMTDEYPPFKLTGADYPAELDFDYQKKSSRLWALLTIIPVKSILLIPHIIILFVIGIITFICMFLGVFATLFTGKYPASFEKVLVTFMRYSWRLGVYFICMTDEYPPISWKE